MAIRNEVIEMYKRSMTPEVVGAPLSRRRFPMHVVFVLPRFYPYRGGYENSLLALSRCLISRGHRVTVFTTVANDLEALWLPGYQDLPPGEEVVDGICSPPLGNLL